MSWFHAVEEHQVGSILGYQNEHPDARYLVEFGDGESYTCDYFASYESENGGELDIEMDDPRYDEFYVVSLDIVETVSDGRRRFNDTLSLDYRDFPVRITDVETGTVVYPATS